MPSSSLWDDLHKLFFDPPVGPWAHVVRALLGLLVALVAVGLPLSLALLWLGAPRFGALFAWLLIAALPWGYVRQVRRAREALRRELVGSPVEGAQVYTVGHARSLQRLREALRAARTGDALLAEVELQHVVRTDLGAWESRMYEAVRTLICLGRGETARAAQLAPLALPTGHEELDRRLGTLMVRGAWDDEVRLRAIERGLFGAGVVLHDLVLLCRVRRDELAGQEPSAMLPRVSVRVSAAAREVGDERLAHDLLARSERQGAYR